MLGAAEVSRLPAAAGAALAVVFFLGIGRPFLRLARHLLPGEDRWTTATATVVLFSAGWTVVATVLGHLGVLTPRAVLLVAALAPLANAVFPIRLAPPKRCPGHAGSTERAAILAALAFFGISTAVAVFAERYAPPGARGYDDTSYHLSAVATWWQWHDLRSVKFPIGDGSTTFYPVAGELFSYLLLVPFGGTDFLARWSDAPFALASLGALASIARLLSLRAGAAGVAVLLYAANPRVFPTGMLGAGNDHAVGFFVLASVSGALLLRRGPDPRRAVFLGASLGLLIGTKYTGAMFLPPLLLLAGACSVPALRRLPSGGIRRTALGGLVAGVTMLGVGGYTYARNAVGAGNPLYPATVTIFGRRLLQGWAGDTIAFLGRTAGSGREAFRLLHEQADLLGPLFRWILLPAAVVAPLFAALFWLASRARRSPPEVRRVAAGEVVLLALPAVLYAEFVRLMQDHRDVRYVYGAVALAGVCAAWLVERLPPRAARLGRAAVFLVASATLVASQARRIGGWDTVLVGALSGAILLFDALRRRTLSPSSRLERTAAYGIAAAALAALASLAGARLLETYLDRKLVPVPAASFLDRIAPAGTTIAFCGGNQPYPFFGRRLQNRLLYVPTYRGPDARGGLAPPLGASFFSWRGPLEFPHHRAVHAEWRENLRRLGASFIVVVRTSDDLPERDWIALEPGAFTRVFRDAGTEVFAIRDAPARSDLLRVDFGRPESDYYVLSRRRPEPRDGVASSALDAPPGGVDLVIPPLDAPATAATLEVDGSEGLVRSLRMSLNGRALDPVTAGPREAAFRIESGAWRAGRNRLSVRPSAPDAGGDVRIAALDLTLDAAHPTPRGGSGDLPANLDAPAEGSLVRGDVLAAAGWCRERGGGRIDPVLFTVDGRDAIPLRSTRPDRPDVVAVLPYVVESRETGFAADLDVSGLAPGGHSLVVELETPDGRRRTLPPRTFRLVR